LVQAWAFTTQSTLSTLQTLAQVPATLPGTFAPVADYLFDATATYGPSTPGNAADIAAIYTGTTRFPFALVGTGGTLNVSIVSPRTAPFLLIIPSALHGAGPFPVVLFGHSLGKSEVRVLAVAGALAAAGYATLATDFVWHGDRSTCVGSHAVLPPAATDDDACANPVLQRCDATSGRCVARDASSRPACNPAASPPGDVTCGLTGQGHCVGNGSGTFVCEGGTFAVGADGIPLISGWNMLDLSNLFASRDNFRQPVLDLVQLERLVRLTGAGSLDSLLPAGQKLDGTRIQYLGQSLGGVEGTLFTAATSDIQRSILNVPGGDLLGIPGNPPRGILLSGANFASDRTALDALLAAQGLFPGTPGYDAFLATGQWVLDPADPVNVAYGMLSPRVPDVATSHPDVFIQYITRDQTIPNNSTNALIAATNRPPHACTVRQFDPSDSDVPLPLRHEFLLNGFTGTPAHQAVTVQAQTQVVTFLNTGSVP
jgi:dienelactone hydrolase